MTATTDAETAADTYRCTKGTGDLPDRPAPPREYRELFAALRDQQLVTVEGDSCCSTCANYEGGQLAEALAADGHPVAGVATYHDQNVERGFDRLLIGYGGHDYPDAAVAGMIVEAAVDAGLEAEWDGDTALKVEVRRPTLGDGR